MKTQHLTYLLVLPFVFLLGLFSCSDDIGENPDLLRSTNYLNLIQGKLESMNMPRPAGSYNYPVYPGLKVACMTGNRSQLWNHSSELVMSPKV